MARIRSIHPGLTTDELYMSMSIACKAFWPLLWMECDDRGLFEWKPIVLKARLFPADQIDMSALLGELNLLGAILNYEIDGKQYGAVKNFCKYQRPKKPNTIHPYTDTVLDFVQFKAAQSSTSSEPVPHQPETAPEKPPQMEDEGDSREEEGKKELLLAQPRAKVNREPGFEEFWAHCPRKVGKGSARLAYRKAVTQTSPETLLAAMRVFAAKQLGKEPNFIPHPASWLNAERWLDAELVPALAGSSAPGIPVFAGTPQWAAWTKHRGGREPPETDIRIDGQQVRRGWRFPTEWPPGVPQDNVSRDTIAA